MPELILNYVKNNVNYHVLIVDDMLDINYVLR